MNDNDTKLAVLRDLTKLAIAPASGGRPGAPMDTGNKPQVQVNTEVVAANTLPAANRQIALTSPRGKNTATKGVKAPKINTSKFGTGMKTTLASADPKEILKLRMEEKIKEANLGQIIAKAPKAWQWGKNLLGFGTKAPDAMNKATPIKNFIQGAKETAKPFTSGQVGRESAKATREAVKQTRQAADEIQGAAGGTPKLFGNKVPTNANMPKKYYTQTTTMPGGQATLSSGKKILLPGEKVIKGPGQHLKSKAIRQMDAKSKLTMNTGRQKGLAREAYKRSQRNTRINELSAKFGRGAGHVARYGTGTALTSAGVGATVQGVRGMKNDIGVVNSIKAAGEGALDASLINPMIGRGSKSNKVIEKALKNKPLPVDQEVKSGFKGNVSAANASKRNSGSDVRYGKDFRPARGVEREKILDNEADQILKDYLKRNPKRLHANRNQQKLDTAVQQNAPQRGQ